MCGRYVVFTEEENEELIEIINGIDQRHKNEGQHMKTGEIFPTDTVPVIIASADYTANTTGSASSVASLSTANKISAEKPIGVHLFRWGFPNYMKSSAVIINARCETLHEKPTFRKLLGTGRCLVPASGFYEWKAADGSTKKKDKYLIRTADSKLMYFAGLYGSFLDKTGIPSTRFVIITTDANHQMSQIHNRMPVILQKPEAMAWISPQYKELDSLLRPYGSELTFDRVG